MPTKSRQLAAIMYTDIVGFTRQMVEDEQKAMQVLSLQTLNIVSQNEIILKQ